jgi:hypothetical protein
MQRWAWLVLLGAVPALAGTTTAKPGSSGNVTLAASQDQAPVHPVTAAQVYEILELTGTETMKRQMIDGMLPYLKQMMPYMPADVVTDFQRSLGATDFEAEIVRSFQQHLSTEDAAQIIAFYRSPVGRHMIGVSRRSSTKASRPGRSWGSG